MQTRRSILIRSILTPLASLILSRRARARPAALHGIPSRAAVVPVAGFVDHAGWVIPAVDRDRLRRRRGE